MSGMDCEAGERGCRPGGGRAVVGHHGRGSVEGTTVLVLGLIFALASSGCGRPCPTLMDSDGGWDRIDGQVRQDAGGPVSCEMDYAACHVSFGPIQVESGELVQDPYVTASHDRIYVVYENYEGMGGTVLRDFDLDGHLLFEDHDVGGWNAPTVAWHPQLGVGLVAADSGLRWLDEGGRPVETFHEMMFFGGQCNPVVAPTPSGFVVVAAPGWYSEQDPLPVGYALMGPGPEDAEWQVLFNDGKPWWPFLRVLDDSGMARFFVSTQWAEYGGAAMGIEVQGDNLRTFPMTPPYDSPSQRTELEIGAAAYFQDSLFVLWIPYDGEARLERMEPHKVWSLSANLMSGYVGLIVVGDDLVLLRNAWQDENGLSMVRLDFDQDGNPERDEEVLVPDDEAAWLLTLAPTGRGFAALWGGSGLPVELLHVDCCLGK